MTDNNDFYAGYSPLPDQDRRFLFKAVPAGLIGLAAAGAVLGSRARSSGGGRWETGTPVTLTGRLSFDPYPTLWIGDEAIVLAGFGKHGSDRYTRPLDGQVVRATGVRIVRGNCFMLGVAEGDIAAIDADLPAAPVPQPSETVSMIGEILDAQCFMGIMNPGYGRTHRGCATLCIRGGQPVYFSPGIRSSKDAAGGLSCGGNGFVLAAPDGGAINQLILDHIAVPVSMTAKLDRMGNMSRLTLVEDSLQRLA